MTDDQNTLVQDAIALERQFRANRCRGEDSNPCFLVKKGAAPIVISAPHAVMHERRGRPKLNEPYTGALALQLHERSGASAIIYASTTGGDPNWDKTSYKATLKQLVQDPATPSFFVLDLHGLNKGHERDAEIGTADGAALMGSNWLLVKLKAALEGEGLKNIAVDESFIGGWRSTITSYTFRELEIPAMQLEIRRDWRNPESAPEKYVHLVSALCSAIRSIQNTLTEYHESHRKVKLSRPQTVFPSSLDPIVEFMPSYKIQELDALGRFQIVPMGSYQADPVEKSYIDRVRVCVEKFGGVPKDELEAPDAGLSDRKRAARRRALGRLRDRVTAWISLERPQRIESAPKETFETYRIEGYFDEWWQRLIVIPFTVETVGEPATDLKISIRDVLIPSERGKLKVEVDSALTVTKTVFSERERSVTWWWWLVGQYETRVQPARDRQNDYVMQLLGIARVGLMNTDPSQVEFARQDLARFRAEFVNREAGIVKNRYIARLGTRCLLAALVFAGLYAYSRSPQSGPILHDFRNFCLLLVGTAAGTWLSFLLRRQVLIFDDLAVLEEDRLNPGMRVLFMIGLTTIIGLLFWTGAVTVGVGNVQSGPAVFTHGAWALLIGFLLGIAERAMGTAVSRQATGLVTVGTARPAGTPSAGRVTGGVGGAGPAALT